MSSASVPTWILTCLPTLLEARTHAHWRPTTLPQESFSLRCMTAVAAVADWTRHPNESRLARVACCFILIIHDLHPVGLIQLAQTMPFDLDDFHDEASTIDWWITEPVIGAWQEWSYDALCACYLIEYAFARYLSFVTKYHPDIEQLVVREMDRMRKSPLNDGRCHPDT